METNYSRSSVLRVAMSGKVCFLCSHVIDPTSTVDDDTKTGKMMRISTLSELLSSSSSSCSHKKITPRFEEDDESCEFCPLCAPVISEMEQIRGQMALLEEQIGLRITKIREMLLDSSKSNGDEGKGEKVHKWRTAILKMMGDNNSHNIVLDEVKVEQDDTNLWPGENYDIFDLSASAAEQNYDEATVPFKYEGDDDGSAFCINPHSQKRGRKKSIRTKRKADFSSSPPEKRTKSNTTGEKVKVENNDERRRSTRRTAKSGGHSRSQGVKRITFPSTKSTSSDQDSDSAQNVGDKKQPHKCPSCAKSFATEATRSYHVARFHSIPCPAPGCSAAFASIKRRDAHKKVAHPELRVVAPNKQRRLSYPERQKLAERVADFYENEAGRDSKKTWEFFKKQGCQRSSVYRYLKIYREEGSVKFKKPDKRFPRPEVEERDRPYKCTSCPKSFLYRYALFRHVACDHTQKKEHVCHICGKDFYTEVNLRTHLKIHDESQRHSCEICGEKFAYPEALQTHRVKKHGADALVCDACGATFATLSGLKKHEWRHTGLTPHECDQCGAKFPRKQQLAVHLTTHSAERPHPCPHCDQAFKTRNKQREHVKRIHTAGYVTPTPYKCAQCGRCFQFPAVLRAHVLQAHTGERPFACAQCGKGFVIRSALTLHLKSKHGIGGTVRRDRLPRSKRDTFEVRGDEEQGGDP